MEDVHAVSKSSRHSKFIAGDRDISPFAAANEYRKRQAQKVSSGHGNSKARKSDSGVILQRDKHSSSSRASTGSANISRHSKASIKGSKSAGSTKVTPGREDDNIRFLSAERKRLEKENEEQRRRLEELMKQEMLIEAAAKKGGGT